MFVAVRCRRQVDGRIGARRSQSATQALPSIKQRGSAVKRKLASVLVSLVFGWLTTAAIAEDDATATSADSSTVNEPAAVTDQATDTAAMGTSTGDETIAASPAETEVK
jgi:hypothetical protein